MSNAFGNIGNHCYVKLILFFLNYPRVVIFSARLVGLRSNLRIRIRLSRKKTNLFPEPDLTFKGKKIPPDQPSGQVSTQITWFSSEIFWRQPALSIFLNNEKFISNQENGLGFWCGSGSAAQGYCLWPLLLQTWLIVPQMMQRSKDRC